MKPKPKLPSRFIAFLQQHIRSWRRLLRNKMTDRSDERNGSDWSTSGEHKNNSEKYFYPFQVTLSIEKLKTDK